MLSKRQKPYDPESLLPSQRLRANVQRLLANNELSAENIGVLCGNINRVATNELADLQRNSSKTNKARFLRGKFTKKNTWMPDYMGNIRTWSTKQQKVVQEVVPMQLIHEIVAVLLKYGDLDVILKTDLMDPLTLGHLRHCGGLQAFGLRPLGRWCSHPVGQV